MPSFAPPVTLSAGNTTVTGIDVDIIVSVYEANTAGVGYAIGDALQRCIFVKTGDQTSGGPDRWINLTTQLTLASPPVAAHLKPLKGAGITAADLGNTLVKTEEQTTSPIFTHLGKNDDAPALATGLGNYTLVGGLKRLVLITVDMAAKMPALISGKIPVQTDDWSCVEYKLDANGQLVYEKEKNGAVVRTRNWSSATDAQGNVTYTAGDWA